MLQNPRVAFRDPVLKSCAMEKDERNQPRPWAGQFAVVFKGIPADGGDPVAVRVFTTESPERHERYDLISAYLRERRLRCLVEFEYRDRAIRSASDGKWYPLIVMEWVPGVTLFKWVRQHSLAGDRSALARVAEQWVEVVRELAEARIAHGDFQHANVMVTDRGQLKLVDYDGMCVPALVGRRNLEVGVVPYQHPQRCEHTLLSLDLDHFSALLVYTALRALAADPGLWQRYVESAGYDKLLFRAEDFQAPAGSSLYHDLLHSPDTEVRNLATRLFESARLPIDQVPPLGQLANSYAKIEMLLHSQQWAAAVELLNRRGNFRDAPAHLQALIRQAFEHVCQQQAWSVLEAVPREVNERNDRRLVQAWNESLFAGYPPAERERQRVAEARQRVSVLDRLAYLALQPLRSVTLAVEQGIVDLAGHLPPDYRYTWRPRVSQARRRLRAIERLGRALAAPVSETEVAVAWKKVAAAGAEFLAGGEQRRRAELATQRYALIRALGQIPDDLPADQYDRRILQTWDDAILAGCSEVAPWRSAYMRAVRRREGIGRLQAALAIGDEPAAVEASGAAELAGYPLPVAWMATIAAARDRQLRTEALLAALIQGSADDFVARFDARLIRGALEQFTPHRELLLRWIHQRILPCQGVGLGRAWGRAGLTPVENSDRIRCRWSWPEPRFSECCRLNATRDEPLPDGDPHAAGLLQQVEIVRSQWEQAGGCYELDGEASLAGAWVSVRAVVDVGFEEFASWPLVLGRLPQPSPGGWLARMFGRGRDGGAARVRPATGSTQEEGQR